jgi:hypothetical protein
MMTDPRNLFKKYKAAENAMETHRSDLERFLKPRFDRYFAEAKMLMPYPSNNCWPDDVETISVWNGMVHISGTSSCRGCTDNESASMPEAFAFGDDAALETELEALRQQRISKEEAMKTAAEAREREQYTKLKEKFG